MIYRRCLCSVGGAVVMFITALAGSTAQAEITTQDLNLTFSNRFAANIFATVHITANDATGLVQFSVDALNIQPLYGSLGNFGIQKFAFNYNSGVVTSTPGSWTKSLPSGWSQSSNQNISEFGRFRFVESGGGGTRKDPLSFSLSLPVASQARASYFATANRDGFVFAAHIAGLGCAPNSHWVAGKLVTPPSVPEPAATVLGSLGLGCLALLRRR